MKPAVQRHRRNDVMPSAPDAERQVLSVAMADESGETWPRILDVPSEAWTDPTCRTIRDALGKMQPPFDPGQAIELGVSSTEQLLPYGSPAQFPRNLERVVDAHRRRQLIKAATRLREAAAGGDGLEEIFDELEPLCDPGRGGGIIQKLQERKFDPAKPITEPRVIFKIDGNPICTAGNLTSINAQIKAGKTAVNGAFLAASMDPTGTADCFGINGFNSKGLAVLHFDTEQSRADHQKLLLLARRRAGVEEFPRWLESFCLTGMSAQECRLAVEYAIKDAARRFGGIWAVLIDGAVDLVIDPNDPKESFPLITRLHDLAGKFDTAIIGTIHFNPGTEKSRGHFGSQLERKAETNLVLEKDRNEIITIYAPRQRGAPIVKDEGPRFKWSAEDAMHLRIIKKIPPHHWELTT